MKNCSRCNTSLVDDADFCHRCGAEQKSQLPEQTASKHTGVSRKTLVMAVAAVLVALIAAVTAVVVIVENSQSEQAAEALTDWAVEMNDTPEAKEASVKEGVHIIQIGVQTWATDHSDVYPTVEDVSSDASGLGQYLDTWPTNPYTGEPMELGTRPGDYAYESDGLNFVLTGYGENGVVISVP